MARLVSSAAAAILAAASSAINVAINPEAPLEAIAACVIAILDSLLTRRRVPEISKTLRKVRQTVLNAIRRRDRHA